MHLGIRGLDQTPFDLHPQRKIHLGDQRAKNGLSRWAKCGTIA